MDIIEEIEKSCLGLERKGIDKKAETLRHDIANILLTSKKPETNLTREERKGLTYIRKN